MYKRSADSQGFTLIELTVVILIIAILMGFVFTAGQGMIDRARKTQAKNDLTQIVTAVNAFYTEYGKYPIATDDTPLASTAGLFYSLRAVPLGANALVNGVPAVNSRGIVFISPPDLATANARSGIGSDGQYYDPWASAYKVAIDGNYDNQISNPYSANAGASTLPVGVIAWSLGKDKLGGVGDKAAGNAKDDVISWQ
jgi:prepilin-type N-terminal cleavage/methylation domain-containing protein